jgi:Fe-S-cluster containining protein
MSSLCLTCGLCCNGVLFRDVRLQPRDDAARLRRLTPGLGLRAGKFPQPCAALCADNRCAHYAERPQHCRAFECALLQSVQRGDTTEATARRHVRDARTRAERVVKLLRALGDTEESLPLARRVEAMHRRMAREATALSPKKAHLFADLTLAAHQLDERLRARFLP